ncbi:hypothetical protein ALC57_18192, partial [Trachymyrmex cornetzi]
RKKKKERERERDIVRKWRTGKKERRWYGVRVRRKKKQGMLYTKVLRERAGKGRSVRSLLHRGGEMRVYGYRYITGGVGGGGRDASVCVQKGEKEGHILYLWVFAATVLSRRRLAAES